MFMGRKRAISTTTLLHYTALFSLLALLLPVTMFNWQGIDSAQNASTAPAFASYHVAGKYILDAQGNIFIPYGVLIDGVLLAQPDWKTDGVLTHDTFDQMQAAHDFWHSNTVRLQIGSTALFAQTPYDASYLAKIDQDVQWATQLGMNIILSLQYEGHGNSGQKMPTQGTLHFWSVIAPHYANNPRVFFDIFNEPDIKDILGQVDTNAAWAFWQNGGTGIDGATYVGMQQVVNSIRRKGVKNLILVEGLAAGEDIMLLPEHTLTGSNIVYAIHPYLNDTNHHSPDDWDSWFGNAAANGNFPVVADEWGEYQSTNGQCINDAPTVVSQFLAYLKSHQIGLIAYGFVPGTLIRGWNFRAPTSYAHANTSCTIDTSIGPNLAANAEGAGQLIRQYFIASSNHVPSPPPPPSGSSSAPSFILPLVIGAILLVLVVVVLAAFSKRRRFSR